MRRVLSILLFATLSAGGAYAQTAQTVTIDLDCWSGGYCAMPCGGSGTGNYACSNGTGQWTDTCAFNDPLPAGAQVRSVKAVIYSHQCASSTNVTATINNTVIQTVTESRASCQCLNSACLDTTAQTTFSNGLPGYNAGASNSFGIYVTSGILCVEHVALTFTYVAKTLQIAATDPVIPANATVQNGCVLYHSDLTATATDQGQPVSGVAVTFTSDRGSPDTFQQPGSTNNRGVATGSVETRKQGVATIGATTNPSGFNVSTTPVYFTRAKYERQFRITAYAVALETDFNGPTVTNPCGLTGTFNSAFLYSNRGVLMEGSGQDAAGNVIGIDFNATPNPTRNNVCFEIQTCPRTASGACAVAGTTIAVDRSIIPMGANVNIDGVGDRIAQDTGGAINGYHIDNFVGFGRAAIQAWNNLNSVVTYISGGGTCN